MICILGQVKYNPLWNMRHIHEITYTLGATQLWIYKSGMTVKTFHAGFNRWYILLNPLFLLCDRNKIKFISGYKEGAEWNECVHDFNIITHINFNEEKTERKSYKIRNKQACPSTLSISIHYSALNLN